MLLYIIGGQFLFGKLLALVPDLGLRSDAARDLRASWRCRSWWRCSSGSAASVRFYRTVFIEEIHTRLRAHGARQGLRRRCASWSRHVLRNALIPILTNVVMAIPFLFTGSLLLESFFGIPGLGALTVDAINGNDFSTLRAMVYIGALLFIVGADPDRHQLHAGRSARAARVAHGAARRRRTSSWLLRRWSAPLASRAAAASGEQRSGASGVAQLVAAAARSRRAWSRSLRRRSRCSTRSRGSAAPPRATRSRRTRPEPHRPRFPGDFEEKSYSAPFASDGVLRRRAARRTPARTCSAPTSSGRDVLYVDAQGRARGAADRRAHQPDRRSRSRSSSESAAGYFGKCIDDVVFFVM